MLDFAICPTPGTWAGQPSLACCVPKCHPSAGRSLDTQNAFNLDPGLTETCLPGVLLLSPCKDLYPRDWVLTFLPQQLTSLSPCAGRGPGQDGPMGRRGPAGRRGEKAQGSSGQAWCTGCVVHGGSPLGVELGGSEGPRLQGPSGWSTAAAPEPWEDPEGLMRATALSRENGENKGAQGLTPPSLVGVSGGKMGSRWLVLPLPALRLHAKGTP